MNESVRQEEIKKDGEINVFRKDSYTELQSN